jgi:hypothetical protein
MLSYVACDLDKIIFTVEYNVFGVYEDCINMIEKTKQTNQPSINERKTNRTKNLKDSPPLHIVIDEVNNCFLSNMGVE